MTQKPSETNVQLNSGSDQRIAANDYHEYQAPEDLPLGLDGWNVDKLEMQTRVSPHMFKKRYGFDATAVCRNKVVDFQKRFELTDSKICSLRSVGAIKVTRTNLKVDGQPFMLIVGWLQVVLSTLLFVVGAVYIGKSAADALKQILGLISLAAIWTLLTTAMVRTYITPWYTLKEAGVLAWVRDSNGNCIFQ